MSSFGATWAALHPASRFFGGSGRQPNTAAPKWHEVSPGRWEMEGGGQAPPFMPSGPLGQMAGNLFQSGGGAPVSQAPGLSTGGGAPVAGGFPGMTGGPMQQMGGFQGQTGGGGQRLSSYGQGGFGGGFDFGPDQLDGGYRGNFGMRGFR